jgi:hypothetical protein
MYSNPRYANEVNGILLDQEAWPGIPLYVDSGEIYEDAKAGKYGPVEPYVPPPTPSDEELAEQLAAEVRAERNRLLAESDWTQMPDARAAMGEVKAAEWDAYRQALRDVPEQEGFPENVVWPTKPE